MSTRTVKLKNSLALSREDYHWRLLCACINTVANYIREDTSLIITNDDNGNDIGSIWEFEGFIKENNIVFVEFVKILFDAKLKEKKEKEHGIANRKN